MAGIGTVRAGVIGAGVFGRFHAQKYAGLANVRLIGVCDASGERAVDAAAAHGVGAFTRIDDLLAEVDVVSVATPATTHAAIVARCLEAGKHVYVEKPIAIDLDDADRLMTLAAVRGLVLQTGHQERLVVGATGLQRRAAAPIKVACVRAGPFSGRSLDVSVVLDLMIHDIDLAQWLIGATPSQVTARERAGPGGASDEVEAELSFPGGATATLFASRNAPERRRRLSATYADGQVEIDFLTKTIVNSTPEVLAPLEIDGKPATPAVGDPVGASVARFVAAVRDGAASYIRPLDARNALETANRILIAARSGTPASVRA